MWAAQSSLITTENGTEAQCQRQCAKLRDTAADWDAVSNLVGKEHGCLLPGLHIIRGEDWGQVEGPSYRKMSSRREETCKTSWWMPLVCLYGGLPRPRAGSQLIFLDYSQKSWRKIFLLAEMVGNSLHSPLGTGRRNLLIDWLVWVMPQAQSDYLYLRWWGGVTFKYKC